METEYIGRASCPICLDCDEDSAWCSLPCGHVLHIPCWEQAKEHRSCCPKCKAKVRQDYSAKRIYLDNEPAPVAQPPSANHERMKAIYESKLNKRDERITTLQAELTQLKQEAEAMVRQQEAQADKVMALKTELKGKKLEWQVKESEHLLRLDAKERELAALVSQLHDTVKHRDRLEQEIVKLKKEVEMLRTKLAYHERTAMSQKLVSNPNIAEAGIRRLLSLEPGSSVDSEVVLAVLTARNNEVLGLRNEIEAMKQQRQRDARQSEVAVADAKRTSAAERDSLARQLADAKHKLLRLEYQLLKEQQEQPGALELAETEEGLPLLPTQQHKQSPPTQSPEPAAQQPCNTAHRSPNQMAQQGAVGMQHQHSSPDEEVMILDDADVLDDDIENNPDMIISSMDPGEQLIDECLEDMPPAPGFIGLLSRSNTAAGQSANTGSCKQIEQSQRQPLQHNNSHINGKSNVIGTPSIDSGFARTSSHVAKRDSEKAQLPVPSQTKRSQAPTSFVGRLPTNTASMGGALQQKSLNIQPSFCSLDKRPNATVNKVGRSNGAVQGKISSFFKSRPEV